MCKKQTFTIEIDRADLFYAIAAISWALDELLDQGWQNMAAFDNNLSLAKHLGLLSQHLNKLAEEAIVEESKERDEK